MRRVAAVIGALALLVGGVAAWQAVQGLRDARRVLNAGGFQ